MTMNTNQQAEAMRRRLNELMAIMSTNDLRFAMEIEKAFDIPGRGTVLSGALLGNVRTKSSVGCLMDARTKKALSGDMEVLGLERFRKLEERLDSGREMIGCGILVSTLAKPEALTGMVFGGGYRVPQTKELQELSEELEGLQQHWGDASFIMLIQEAFDLGEEGTGLVGWLQGAVFAGRDAATVTSRDGKELLSDAELVTSLLYRGKEEESLISRKGLLPCGVVISERHAPASLAGRLLIQTGTVK